MNMIYCLLFLFAASSIQTSIIHEYFDTEHRIKCPQTIQDISSVRKVVGTLIRYCDERPLSSIKYTELVESINGLCELFVSSDRLHATVTDCKLCEATWDLLRSNIFLSGFISQNYLGITRVVFEEFFMIDNPFLRPFIDDVLDSIKDEIYNLQVGDAFSVQDIFFDKELSIDLGFIPKSFSDSIKIFVTMYFDHIDFFIKKNIIASLIESAPGISLQRALFKALQECGPILQKIFQLLVDEVANEELAEFNTSLKIFVRKMSEEELVKVFIKTFGSYQEFCHIFQSFILQPVSTATVAQGHFATLRESGRDVFVKVKKIDVEQKMGMDFELMRTLVEKHPQYDGIYKQLQQNLTAEMDWEREVNNMVLAKQCYENPSMGIYVPDFHTTYPSTKPQFIVMERVDGVPLIPFVPKSKEHACTLIRLLSNMYKIWWNEAIYQTGYMHGDIHGGNLLYAFNESDPSSSKLYVIDYGNVKMLDSFIRESVVEIALGVYLRDSTAIANGLGRLKYPEEAELWKSLIRQLDEFMSREQVKRMDVDERITEILKYISGIVDLPSSKDIVIFFRAKGLFDGIFKYLRNGYQQQFEDYGCPIPQSNTLAKCVAFWSVKNVYLSAVYGRRVWASVMRSSITFFPRLVTNFLMSMLTITNYSENETAGEMISKSAAEQLFDGESDQKDAMIPNYATLEGQGCDAQEELSGKESNLIEEQDVIAGTNVETKNENSCNDFEVDSSLKKDFEERTSDKQIFLVEGSGESQREVNFLKKVTENLTTTPKGLTKNQRRILESENINSKIKPELLENCPNEEKPGYIYDIQHDFSDDINIGEDIVSLHSQLSTYTSDCCDSDWENEYSPEYEKISNPVVNTKYKLKE